MADWFERVELSLVPLSPIHVGTGQALDWMSSVLDARAERVLLLDNSVLDAQTYAKINTFSQRVFDPKLDIVKFVRDLQTELKKRVAEIRVSRPASLAILPQLARYLDQHTGGSTQGRASNREAAQTLQIERCMLDPRSLRPIFPGSSIKGALRTAWTDRYDPTVSARNLFHEDPFSLVQLEDFIASGACESAIIAARSVKRSSSRAPSVPLQVEAYCPQTDLVFSGAVRFRTREGVAGPSAPKLLDVCHAFHADHWREQRGQLKAHVADWWFSGMERIVDALSGSAKGLAYLVRVGKFCSAESKTTRERKITVRGARGQSTDNLKHGTTFWIADDRNTGESIGGLSFGWALLVPKASKVDEANELVSRFRAEAPWKFLSHIPESNSATDRVSGTAFTASEGDRIIEDLKNRVLQKSLGVDYLKSVIRGLVNLNSAEEGQKVKQWIEAGLKSSPPIIPGYQQASVTQALNAVK